MSVEIPIEDEPKPRLDQRRSSNVRKVSGVDLSTHHYVPFIPKRRPSQGGICRITASSEPFSDYKHIFPYIYPDGKTTLLTEYDFHNKMCRKYQALLGDTYIYPILGTNLTVEKDMLQELTREDTKYLELLILPEVEIMIPGGIATIRTNFKRIGLFIVGKRNDIFPAGLKMIKNREIKELEKKLEDRSFLNKNFAVPDIGESTTSDHVVEQFLTGMNIPNVKHLREVLHIVESEEEFLAKMKAHGILHTSVEQLDLPTYYENVRNRKNRFIDTGDWREYKDDEPFDWSEWDAFSKRRDTLTGEDLGINLNDLAASANAVLICDAPDCEETGKEARNESLGDEGIPPLVSAKAEEDDDFFINHKANDSQ